MKRLFLLTLVGLLAGVGLIVLIEHDAGYVLLSYGHYTIETSVWVALALLLGSVLLIAAIVYGFKALIGRSAFAGRWLVNRRFRSSQRLTTLGLIDFIEGNFKRARKRLEQGATRSDTPLINYLMAARAADELGDQKSVKGFLQQAEESTVGAGTAVELTQAELELKKGHYEQSLATLMRARRNGGQQPYTLRLLLASYKGLNDWQNLLELLPELKKNNVIDHAELLQLERHAWSAQLEQASSHKTAALEELEKVWHQLPRSLNNDREALVAYTSALIKVGAEEKAEAILRKQLNQSWDQALVELYGRVCGRDVAKQLIHAEHWLQERNSDAVLYRALGRIALRNELWGKARDYFETSLKLDRNGETCAELGRLYAHLGETGKSNDHFHEGLLLSTQHLPELPLPSMTRITS